MARANNLLERMGREKPIMVTKENLLEVKLAMDDLLVRVIPANFNLSTFPRKPSMKSTT